MAHDRSPRSYVARLLVVVLPLKVSSYALTSGEVARSPTSRISKLK
jgi:hypothetical protein